MKYSYVPYLLSLSAGFAAALPATDSMVQDVVTVRYNEASYARVPLRPETYYSNEVSYLWGETAIPETEVSQAEIEAGPDRVRCTFWKADPYKRRGDHMLIAPVAVTKERPLNLRYTLQGAVSVKCTVRFEDVTDEEQDEWLMTEYLQSQEPARQQIYPEQGFDIPLRSSTDNDPDVNFELDGESMRDYFSRKIDLESFGLDSNQSPDDPSGSPEGGDRDGPSDSLEGEDFPE